MSISEKLCEDTRYIPQILDLLQRVLLHSGRNIFGGMVRKLPWSPPELRALQGSNNGGGAKTPLMDTVTSTYLTNSGPFLHGGPKQQETVSIEKKSRQR